MLHTADWHLGKTLNDNPREEEHRLFLDWLLHLITTSGTDAVIIAGDIFDTANPPNSALQQYYTFVSRVFQSGSGQSGSGQSGSGQSGSREILVVAGNHDSAAQLEAPRDALRALNVHVAGSPAGDPRDRILLLPRSGEPQVAIAMIPFLRDRDLRTGYDGEGTGEIRAALQEGIRRCYHETADALRHLEAPVPAIATGHLTVLGGTGSESEREIHVGGLGAVPPDIFPREFAYVALGHLHRPQSGSSGADTIRYSGSPIPLSFSEAEDGKEVRILDITGGVLTHHPLPVPRFRRLFRLRTTVDTLIPSLTALLEDAERDRPDTPGQLPSWIEITVSGAATPAELNETVSRVMENRRSAVLRVLRERSDSAEPFSLGDATDDEALDTLIDDPRRLFDHLLNQEEEMTPEDRESLHLLFTGLLETEIHGTTAS